jgi:predicted transposase YbfD/YdcC
MATNSMRSSRPSLSEGRAQSRCGDQPSRLQTPEAKADHRHLASDGKTLRATSKQAHPVHQLSCSEVSTGRVLWHCNVQEKHNEISELKPFLTTATVKGRILSLDALHTQRQFCAQVKRLEGDYVLFAKDNQPTLKEDSADLFEDRTPDRRRWQEAETWEKGHGRLEHRQIVSRPDLNDWFANEWQDTLAGLSHRTHGPPAQNRRDPPRGGLRAQ